MAGGAWAITDECHTAGEEMGEKAENFPSKVSSL